MAIAGTHLCLSKKRKPCSMFSARFPSIIHFLTIISATQDTLRELISAAVL